MTNVREFPDILVVQKIKIGETEYELRELTRGSRRRYLQTLNGTMEVRMESTGEVDANGKEKMQKRILMKDLNGAQDTLLKETLYKVCDDGTTRQCTVKELDAIPSKVSEEIAEMASDLNGLEKADGELNEEAVKN